MSEFPNVETVAAQQLWDEIAQIETRWPQFVDLKASDLCRCRGMGCTTEEARARWGDDAANAWRELSNARWLLGED